VPADTLVLFDLDHTLVPYDSEMVFVEYLIDVGRLDRAEVESRSAALTESYNRGEAATIEFTEFYLGLLARFEMAELDRLRDAWIVERVRPRINAAARGLVERHTAAGDEVVVTTAVFRYLAEPQVREFAIVNLLATEAEVVAGRFTGRVLGMANSREGKVERLLDWLSSQGRRLSDFRAIWVYADSVNDLSLLSHATHPIAVNPDPILSAHARHAGWETRWLPGSDRLAVGSAFKVGER
jgi:HAD superfamily hydrolase (TIGR01490 family)